MKIHDDDTMQKKVLKSYHQSMRNLKEINHTQTDPVSPRNVTGMLASNRIAAKFNPDSLTNLYYIRPSKKGSITIVKTEDSTNKFSIPSNKLNKIGKMTNDGLSNFRMDILRDLNDKHRDGIHDISNFFLRHCRDKLVVQNILGDFVEDYNADINIMAPKQSNSEFPTQFLFKLMLVFANCNNDYKVDIIKFA